MAKSFQLVHHLFFDDGLGLSEVGQRFLVLTDIQVKLSKLKVYGTLDAFVAFGELLNDVKHLQIVLFGASHVSIELAIVSFLAQAINSEATHNFISIFLLVLSQRNCVSQEKTTSKIIQDLVAQ